MSDNIEIKKAACCLCLNMCGAEVHVKDGEAVGVKGDKQFRSQGFICEKCREVINYHNHPKRLNYPLKRVGARGENKWQRISWNQGLDEVAEKLSKIRDEYGPEAVATLGGIGAMSEYFAAPRWANLFGTPNCLSSTKNCWQPHLCLEMAVQGAPNYPDLPRPGATKCMLVFANPYEAMAPYWSRFLEAKRKGAKVIVVDPRRTRTAEEADLWLQIKPGTDGALIYGMLNVIIEEGLYDKEFVDKWCLGFDELRQFIKAYPPKVVGDITWIPQEKIVEAARTYAINKPALASAMWGVTHSQLGKGRVFAANLGKCILRSITGNLAVRGGEEFRPLIAAAWDQNMLWDKLFDHPLRTRDILGADEYPIMSLKALKLFRQAWTKVYGENGFPEQMGLFPNVTPHYLWSAILDEKPYPVKALLNEGMNPLVTRSNARMIYQALKSDKLELHVAKNLFMNPSDMLSDYIFPVADWLEKPYMEPPYYFTNLGEQSVKPKYERRTDYDFWRGLGVRLGQEEYWPETIEDMYDKFLEPLGVNFEELVRRIRCEQDYGSFRPSYRYKAYETVGFGTPSGKVELVPSIFRELGYKLLPHYSELPQIPGVTGSPEEYPLILATGGRTRTFYHSQLREMEKLRASRPNPIIQIHPDTAREYGIGNGDWVYIETPKGKIKQKAEVTDRIHPRVVHAEHGWWFPEKPGEDPSLFGLWESALSCILPDEPEVCDYQGGPPLRALQCQISKV